MSVKAWEKYQPNASSPSPQYPYGSLRQETALGMGDGTPLDVEWGNDFEAFKQTAFSRSGLVPSGNTDTVINSEMFNAMQDSSTRTLWKRSIAEAGYNLVAGSFEEGGTVTTATDVLWFKKDNKTYSYTGTLPHTVSSGSSPSAEPEMWVDRSNEALGFSYDMTYQAKTVGRHLQKMVCVTDAPFNADPTFTTECSDAFIGAISWAALNGASVVWVPTGRYKLSKGFQVPVGITLEGDGIDYWDTYRPDPTRLLKSWDRGTHLVFVGTGAKNKTCRNLHNARPTKTVGGVAYPFTDFTNNDSVAGAPATAKPFSVAVSVLRGAQLKNMRIMVSKNGINGYNDASSLTLGDDWDVGVWVYDSSDAVVENIQSVGYWRMAGWLVTENDGTYTLKGNPERTKFHKLLGQGRRGLLQRNSPQIDVLSNTSSAVTCKYNSSWTLTAQNQFTIPGSASVKYTFTGYSVTGSAITLTGVTPALPVGITAIRAPNQGNNFSGSVFTDSVFFGLEHTSGTKSADLGIGEAGAFEIDGYPMRNLKFINAKFQTIFDRLNGIWGDCRDVKLVGCEHENGVLIAYDVSETQGYTGNLRYVNSDIQSTVDTTAYTPRDAFDDYKQFPTRFSDGSFAIKNWRATNLSVQWFSGYKALHLDETNNRLDIRDRQDVTRIRVFGGSGTDYHGSQHTFKDLSGTTAVTIYTPSKNIECGGNVTPAVANTGSLGTVSTPWANGAMQTAMTITSDERTKSLPEKIPDAMLDAWSEVDWVLYQILGRIEVKGVDGARWHSGIIAQRAMDAFERHGLDPRKYGFFCYDKWGYEPAITHEHPAEHDEDGVCIAEAWVEVIRPEQQPGELYSIRYEEALAIEAALQRRERQRDREAFEAFKSDITVRLVELEGKA